MSARCCGLQLKESKIGCLRAIIRRRNRSSRSHVFFKKAVLKYFAEFNREHILLHQNKKALRPFYHKNIFDRK